MDIQALYSAISAVCPIDGVSGDGEVWFHATATPAHQAAAQTVIKGWVDPPPVVTCALWQLQAVMTTAEWSAVQATVVALNNPAVSAFFAHGTNMIPSNSKTLLAMGAAIGLTPAQVLAVITQASKVVIP